MGVTMAMQHPTDTSPEPDMDIMATLYLMVTSQDTVTMAVQHPTDTSPEPDMDTMATLYLMSHMQHPIVMSQEPDMDTMATLYLMVMSQEPDMDTMATLYLMSQMQHPMGTTAILLMATSPDTATTVTLPMSPDTTKPSPSYEPRYGYNGYSSYGYQPTYGR